MTSLAFSVTSGLPSTSRGCANSGMAVQVGGVVGVGGQWQIQVLRCESNVERPCAGGAAQVKRRIALPGLNLKLPGGVVVQVAPAGTVGHETDQPAQHEQHCTETPVSGGNGQAAGAEQE